jgi:pyruvate dehydrogenase (quinone)
VVRPDDESLRRAADILNAGERVTILAGAGAAGAHDELVQLASTLNAPVVHALRGKEFVEYDNPYDVGMTGLLGFTSGYKAIKEADTLLMLGTDFPYDDFLPRSANVQVDLDPVRLGRRVPIVQGIAADVGQTVRALLEHVPERQDHSFLDRMLRRHLKAVERSVETYNVRPPKAAPIHPEHLAAVIDKVAAPDAVFTVDTGMCCTWTARYINPNGRRRLLGSWVHGSMANALPMALGAQVSHPGRQVVSLSGDGGLAMLLGELLTAKTHQLPVKVVVFNNSSLGMVRLEMLVAGDPPFETDHDPVDFAAIAAGAGFFTRRVTRPDDVRAAAEEVFAFDGPALLDVVTTADALEVPSHVTVEQARGFALGLGTVVLDGGVGKVAELARLNLRNIPRP